MPLQGRYGGANGLGCTFNRDPARRLRLTAPVAEQLCPSQLGRVRRASGASVPVRCVIEEPRRTTGNASGQSNSNSSSSNHGASSSRTPRQPHKRWTHQHPNTHLHQHQQQQHRRQPAAAAAAPSSSPASQSPPPAIPLDPILLPGPHTRTQQPRGSSNSPLASSGGATAGAAPAQAAAAGDDDVLELNVGGRLMQTTRGTLTQVPGSRLASWFAADSPAFAALARDACGRVWLDLDPQLFGLVLRQLRERRMEAGTGGSCPPPIPPSDESALRRLVSYLGLQPYQPAATSTATAADGPAHSHNITDGAQLADHMPQPDAKEQQQQQQQQQQLRYSSKNHQPHQPKSSRSRGATFSSASGLPSSSVPPLSCTAHGTDSGPLHLAPPPTPSASRLPSSLPSPATTAVSSSPALSQLFYISADLSETKGLRISVHTESDLALAPPQPPSTAASQPSNSCAASPPPPAAALPFDAFVDATYGDNQLSLTFVSRRELPPGGVFLGLASRSQLDRRQIPSFGWRSNGSTFNDRNGGGRLTDAEVDRRRRAGGGGSSSGSINKGVGAGTLRLGGGLGPTAGDEPLWGRGDSVELIMRQGQQHNQLLLKVNGRHVDVINRLPPVRHWCWYLALWMGGDVSCAVFQRDQYAVYWGDYMVKRFL